MPEIGLAITPSRPAPSKRLNQSDATHGSRVAGVRWIGGIALASNDSSFSRRRSNGSFSQSRSPSHSRSKKTIDAGTLPGKQFHPRGSRMNPKLQFLEVEPIVLCDNDFAVENASSGQLRIQRLEQLGKVSIQRFRIAALNKDFVSVAEDQRAETRPIRQRRLDFSARAS